MAELGPGAVAPPALRPPGGRRRGGTRLPWILAEAAGVHASGIHATASGADSEAGGVTRADLVWLQLLSLSSSLLIWVPRSVSSSTFLFIFPLALMVLDFGG